MRLTQSTRTLLAAASLALLGAVASAPMTWAQEAVEGQTATTGAADEGVTAPAAEGQAETAPGATGETEGAADASTVEGGPAEPTDAVDGATEAATDGTGNTSDDPAPGADAGAANEAASVAPAGGFDLAIRGAPRQGGIDFQPASSKIARDTQWLDGMLNWIIGAIVVFVTALMAWVAYRYNERRNPNPAGFTHNSPLEIAWTIVPIVILVFIGAFSLPVLFEQQEIPEGDVNIKVTGYQWFWNYEYLDEGILFDSYMIGYGEGNLNPAVSAELAEAGFSDDEFRLATDTAVVVPVGATVVMTVTGGDVIHSWTVPAFGVKQDAVPGRLAQLWFAAEEEGIYFGQCSELCGKDHAFMPIQVRVVSQEAYDAWVVQAQAEFPAS